MPLKLRSWGVKHWRKEQTEEGDAEHASGGESQAFFNCGIEVSW
jgi:hypothetical protein